MRVLYVTAEVPYPLSSGYLRHYQLMRLLSLRHEIVLLSLTRRAAVDPDARVALGAFTERMHVFGAMRSGRSRLRRSLRLRSAARDLRRAVADHLATGHVDAVVLSGKDTFRAIAAVGATPLVVDMCDAASVRLQGEMQLARGRRRLALAVRAAEVRRIEQRLAARTPHLLFASERDREAVVGDGRGCVMPNAVDLAYWSRTEPSAGGELIAFTGVMGFAPNHDAALRLVRDVLPLVRTQRPGARVVLAGRDPRPALLAAAHDGVEVTGACRDLRPHMQRAAVYCAPLRFAAGIQNKLLEALAMEMAVVTTPVAAGGLRIDGEDAPLVVAEDDDAIAGAILRLLGDARERERLAAAGRAFVERHFSWERSVALLERELERAVRVAAAAGPAPPAAGDLPTAVVSR